MTKLCPRGKAAAKRKFKVYPSAYATERLRRQGLKRGGGVCVRGLNRDAVGKNS